MTGSARYADGLQERAAGVLPEAVLRYLRQGARDGVSASEATAAWDRYRFLPAVLRDVGAVHTGTTLLGTPVRTPVGVAPTTMQRAVHPGGEVAMAEGVARAGGLVVVSSNAGSTFADIAATGVAWWLQMYVTADRSRSLPVLERAVEAGARAVVLTVDTPVVGTKYDGAGPTVWDVVDPGHLRVNFPAGYDGSGADEKATDLGPADIAWLADRTGLPVVAKGVLRPVDARRCVDAGAAAVWVSNHGGRQLDGALDTGTCLPAVAAEVGSSAEVYVDGGLREARHVLAALGLGARGVFLGRPPVYALAVDGAAGVETLLRELEGALAEALALSGCPSVESLHADLVVRPSDR